MSSIAILCALTPSLWLHTQTADEARITRDIADGRSIVVHVVVALADNEHQGIAPVKPSLGDGSKPESNLYWGARYGVRSHLPRAGYRLESAQSNPFENVLERRVFSRTLRRGARRAKVVVVADAWAGSAIRPAIEKFLRYAAGHDTEEVKVGKTRLETGGASHLVIYAGHNGLMEFPPPSVEAQKGKEARGAAVFACYSRTYFGSLLTALGARPVVLTDSLMAPEAYVVDAVIRAYVEGATARQLRARTLEAYCRFQGCQPAAARTMFVTGTVPPS